jgi:hypothetical protein
VKTSWRGLLLATLPALAGIACDTGTISNPDVDEVEDQTSDDPPSPDPTSGTDSAWEPSGPTVTLDFDGSAEDFRNPERGYYVGLDLLDGNDAAWVRSSGHTLAIALVNLQDYLDRPLDAALLDALRAGFADVRSAGIKVIVRFAYNYDSGGADAERDLVLRHIDQLAPLLWDNADVISVVQAGFIGAWGEWHSSASGLDNDTDRGMILRALLDALPPSRTVQIRTPMFKEAIFPGGPLDPSEAWSGEDRARVGHHNDCFLASASDYGTFASPIAEWEDYVELDGRFLPVGGETCRLNAPKTDCAQALQYMSDQHWSYLNEEYNQTVLGTWVNQGCAADVSRQLGYRLSLVSATLSESVAPGGVLEVKLEVDNAGFSAPFNPRPIILVVRRGGRMWRVRLAGQNARQLQPGTRSIDARLRFPADAEPAGDYELALWLPDRSAGLRSDPRYSIRLANQGVWNATRGWNVVTRALVIDRSAPGDDVDPTATKLEELPR